MIEYKCEPFIKIINNKLGKVTYLIVLAAYLPGKDCATKLN